MDVFKNRGNAVKPPKWMVFFFNGKTPIKSRMDDLGVKPTIFGNAHMDHPKLPYDLEDSGAL